MGTNYYVVETSDTVCEHCGSTKAGEKKHIGKSSAGWVFSLHVYEDGPHSLDDWLPILHSKTILNEHGEEVTFSDMLAIIVCREGVREGVHLDVRTDEFYAKNYAELGPKGLIRSTWERNKIWHGAGTWDCHMHDFR